MRTIKFRAWDSDTKHMMYDRDQDPKFDPDDGHNSLGYRPITALRGDSNDYIWMQFTGLLDKNGKEIYEGDITDCGVVKFQTDLNWDGGGSVHSGFYFDVSNCDGELEYHDSLDKCEVIGNIYENADLIKIPGVG